MCGIVGYIGGRKAASVALESLRKLEYRGYDSAGFATVYRGSLSVKKAVGKIDEASEGFGVEKAEGTVAIAHSRWATHGKVTKENAHPHCDCKNSVAIVHNGIIENFQELRTGLEKRGHCFLSETDSEVLAHLIEENISGNSLEVAVSLALKEVKGSYAILAISKSDGDKFVAARRESPLLIGLGKDEVFASSDALPLLGRASKAIVLGEGQVALVTPKSVKVFDPEGVEVSPVLQDLNWSVQEASKNGFEHFMLKEILEEPQMIKSALAQDQRLLEEMAGEIVRAHRVMFIACGTSRHSALVGRYLFSRLADKYCDVMIGSEYSYFADQADRKTLVLAISQSGETADVLDGVRRAKAKGARVFSLVNVVNSSLDRLSDRSILLNCGPEIGVAATKSFINQLVVFYLLAFAAVGRFEEGKSLLGQMAEDVQLTINENKEKAIKLAEKIHNKPAAYFLGRGINFAIALEGALKFKEVTYIHAEGMPAGELKHGTLALIDKGTPVVSLNPKDYTYYETLSNALETKARGAFLIGVGDEENVEYDSFMKIPVVEEIFYPLLTIVPLQLLAYYTAVKKGNDPDRPRNLAKSVTCK
ncbi:MAG: glutamine--fructose-6-phosphate transaminase (isomerizing) [Candidatus Micrarchaeia archaeon]